MSTAWAAGATPSPSDSICPGAWALKRSTRRWFKRQRFCNVMLAENHGSCLFIVSDR